MNALDGVEEIRRYLEANPDLIGILELSYDGYHAPDFVVISEETDVEKIEKTMGDHREAYDGYRWYTIYTLEKGELFKFSGYEAEAWNVGRRAKK